MKELVESIVERCASLVDLIGIFVLTAFAVYALIYGIIRLIKREELRQLFRNMRQRLGRGLLLGLEFLVAADIMETVALGLSFTTVGTLAIIVLIRTFLSFSLEAELTDGLGNRSQAIIVVTRRDAVLASDLT